MWEIVQKLAAKTAQKAVAKIDMTDVMTQSNVADVMTLFKFIVKDVLL